MTELGKTEMAAMYRIADLPIIAIFTAAAAPAERILNHIGETAAHAHARLGRCTEAELGLRPRLPA